MQPRARQNTCRISLHASPRHMHTGQAMLGSCHGVRHVDVLYDMMDSLGPHAQSFALLNRSMPVLTWCRELVLIHSWIKYRGAWCDLKAFMISDHSTRPSALKPF